MSEKKRQASEATDDRVSKLRKIFADIKERGLEEEKRKNLPELTNQEAFEKLGGVDELEKYKDKSKELKQKVAKYSELIDKVIAEIAPVPDEWRAKSTKLINQPYVENLDQLYAKAEKVMKPFDELIKNFANETKSKAILAPLKSRTRAESKAQFKYKDGKGVSYYRITDIVRATLEYPTLAAMYEGAEIILDSLEDAVKEFNDRFQSPIDDDYRDLQMTFEIEGFMCELQLSTEFMLQAKATKGHRSYEVSRELLAAVTVPALPVQVLLMVLPDRVLFIDYDIIRL